MEGAAFGAPLGAIAGGMIGSIGGTGTMILAAMGGAAVGGVLGHMIGAGGRNDDLRQSSLTPARGTDPVRDDESLIPRFVEDQRRELGGGTFSSYESRLRAKWEAREEARRLPWIEVRGEIQEAWDRLSKRPVG